MKGTAYLIQGTLVSLWWLALAVSDNFYQAFQFPNIPEIAFNSFLMPDIILITSLSIWRAYRPSKELELIILGGFAYGSLYCLNASILSSGGYLPTTIMLLGLFYNLFLVYQSKVFNEAKSQSLFVNVLKTIIQIICVWSITFILFPWIIIDAFGIETLTSSWVKMFSYLVFILSCILGLSSAFYIITFGNGTPLPADQTKNLVINGPYRYVRNPMAIAGMVQGLAIGIYFGSIHLMVYTLIGGLLWHFVLRPIEEKNMYERFGDEYENYRKEVSVWVPKLNPK